MQQQMEPGDKMGSDNDLERVRADHERARAAGFAPPDTVVPFGIEVVADGQDRYHESRAEWDRQSGAGQMCKDVQALVAQQDRQDLVLPLCDLSMNAYGELVRQVGVSDPMVLTTHAWRQLANFGAGRKEERTRLLPRGTADYLSDPRTALSRRGSEMSYHLSQVPGNVRCKLRTRAGGNGGRVVYAVVSPSYNDGCDVDKTAAWLGAQKKIPGGRGRALVEGAAWSLEVLWHSSLKPGEKVLAGELFKGGVRIKASDDGSEGYDVSCLLWFNLCRNFLIIGESKKTVGHTTHRRKDLTEWMPEQVKAALSIMDGFTVGWQEADKTALLGKRFADPSEAFGKLVEVGLLEVPEGSGLSDKEYVDRLVVAHLTAGTWDSRIGDPGHYISVADAVNAVTRAAHQFPWASQWMQQDEEEKAGKLYQEVRVYQSN